MCNWVTMLLEVGKKGKKKMIILIREKKKVFLVAILSIPESTSIDEIKRIVLWLAAP